LTEIPKEPEIDALLSEQPPQFEINEPTPPEFLEKQLEPQPLESISPLPKISKKGRKPKSEASSSKVSESTHQALSKAGKKGAAKRWGKPLEKEEEGASENVEPSSSTKHSKVQKAAVDPEISHAFSKIGYMGGKARGGEESKGPIDSETHEALSKAGKLGAAKRWGKVRENQGIQKERGGGSHVMTRSQTNHNSSGQK